MWTFGKKIAIGFAVSFLLLLGIGGVAYRSIDALTKTSYWVTHTHNVLEHLTALVSQLKDAETGQRGFVITGDDTYLEPYEAAIVSVPKLLKDLRELTADNANQQKRIAAAEPVVAAKLAELKRTVEMRRQAGLEATVKSIQAGEGKREMDELRRLTAEMGQEEKALLKQRADEVEAVADGTRKTIILG